MLSGVRARLRKIVGRRLRKRMDLEYFRVMRAGGIGLWESYVIASAARPTAMLLRRRGRRLLAPAVRALKTAGMKPFLMWGSLLGHRRDGGFIAHDHDVDLCIDAPNLAKIDALREAAAAAGLALRGISPFLFRIEDRRLDALWIDVWVQYRIGGDCVVAMHDHRDRKGFYVYRLPVELLATFEEVEFEGCRIDAPVEADRLLDLCYGNWRVPDPDHYEDRCPCATLEDAPPRVTPACAPFWPEPR